MVGANGSGSRYRTTRDRFRAIVTERMLPSRSLVCDGFDAPPPFQRAPNPLLQTPLVMSRLDEMTLHASVSTRRLERVPARSAGDRILSDQVAPESAPTEARQRFLDDPQMSAIKDARRDLRMLKATVRRLAADCDTIVRQSDVRQEDAPAPRNRERDALHLQARADAVAVLIQETEGVLSRLEAQA